MRRFLLTTATASVIALTGCVEINLGSEAYAHRNGQGLVGGELTATLDEPGDFSIAGADVSLSGSVAGELDVAAADFTARNLRTGALDLAAADIAFTGAVDGDAVVRAADVQWSGEIGGDADFAAADLTMDGRVTGHFDGRLADAELSGAYGSVQLSAADVRLGPNARVDRDFYANLAELDLRGDVGGALDVQARTVRISGDVEGPMTLNVDPGQGRLDRDDGLVEISGRTAGGTICARRVVISGEVTGPLSIMADSPPELSAGANAASIDFNPRNGQRCERA